MLRPLILTLSLLLALAFPAMAQRQAAATLAEPTADQQAILAGVGTVQVPENLLPGAVCFFGENAFPILLGQPSANVAAPMAAGAHYEKGRVVIFGHDQLIRSDFFNADDNNRTLCLNLVAWLSRKTATGENKPRDEIRVVVIGELEMIAFLITRGVKADFFRTLTDEAIPDRYDVLIINAERIRSEDVEKIDQFVKNGGGLMTSATGWGWQQLNPNGNLKTTFAGNQLTAPM
ncbi:MAG: GldG family protein, partial [Planctomycetaceae bacterium]|nr:GldG family protein [Planctomycetaceae bacterium]